GAIVGTAGQTGGGGAITVRYDCLRQLAGHDGHLPALPDSKALAVGGATFMVALQRVLRVKDATDLPLEGIGVHVVDTNVHSLTERDVFNGNANLIAFATERL